MRVLVACEFSGRVRDAFAARGHDAWSCDLLPSESWQPVKFAADMPQCDCCEDAWCPEHDNHFVECPCIGPTEDDVMYSDDGSRGSRHFQCDVRDILESDDTGGCLILCNSGGLCAGPYYEWKTLDAAPLAICRAFCQMPESRTEA